MRKAMVKADVGDNGYGEDPTVNLLETMAAEMLGKQAACFMPSGTMCNLTAMLVHCNRGREVILGDQSDIYNYEVGGASALGGLVFHPVPTQPDGRLEMQDLNNAIRGTDGAPPGMVCVENPHCLSGGRVLPISYLEQVRHFADVQNLPLHIDGARIFNAATALNVPAARIAAFGDSLQFCLSKNLAAPIGSLLVGGEDFIREALMVRKMLGGTMRQAGVVAAAGIVALETMVDRLGDDHRRTKRLASGLSSLDGIQVDNPDPQTNMVFFQVTCPHFSCKTFLNALQGEGIRMGTLGMDRIRAVVHYGHSDENIETVIATVARVLKRS